MQYLRSLTHNLVRPIHRNLLGILRLEAYTHANMYTSNDIQTKGHRTKGQRSDIYALCLTLYTQKRVHNICTFGPVFIGPFSKLAHVLCTLRRLEELNLFETGNWYCVIYLQQFQYSTKIQARVVVYHISNAHIYHEFVSEFDF